VISCLELFADPAAVDDGEIVEAHGRDADEELAVACSGATTIDRVSSPVGGPRSSLLS